MQKNIEYTFIVGRNEDVAAASFFTLYEDNIEEYDKQDIVTNIEFYAIVPSIRKYFFNQRMVGFLNKIELSDKKYQTNGNERDERYC